MFGGTEEMSEKNPFEASDTQANWTHSERRESNRVKRTAKVRPWDEVDDGAWMEAPCTVSLSGVFFTKDVLPEHLRETEVELEVDLETEGELKRRGQLKPLEHRGGVLLALDELEFEESRQLARFLDDHKEDPFSEESEE